MRHYNTKFPLCSEEDYVKIYLDEIPKYELTKEKEAEYFKKIKAGDQEAKEEFYLQNLSLVVSTIKKSFKNMDSNNSYDIMDLIQLGNIGLMKAIDKFDPSKGYKFSTYAIRWIKQEPLRMLYEDRNIIRLPLDRAVDFYKYYRVKTSLFEKLRRTPKDEEIMKELKWKKNKYKDIKSLDITIISTDAPVDNDKTRAGNGGDTDLNILSSIKSDDDNPLEILERSDLRYLLDKISEKKLTEKEKYVLYERNGLYDDTPKTLQNIADVYGVTRERIRVIEKRAYEKIRDCKELEKLSGYVQKEKIKKLRLEKRIK